ncbi:hypothetical protein [Pseudoalteromonas sp.]|uniref:hypothetical protein n=1 Tax=Pseudoalteromonas sp. TaxID=53249 RepID=UPI00356AAD21
MIFFKLTGYLLIASITVFTTEYFDVFKKDATETFLLYEPNISIDYKILKEIGRDKGVKLSGALSKKEDREYKALSRLNNNNFLSSIAHSCGIDIEDESTPLAKYSEIRRHTIYKFSVIKFSGPFAGKGACLLDAFNKTLDFAYKQDITKRLDNIAKLDIDAYSQDIKLFISDKKEYLEVLSRLHSTDARNYTFWQINQSNPNASTLSDSISFSIILMILWFFIVRLFKAA